MKKSKRAAVFLDRDGTILTERGYLGDPSRIYFYPSAIAGLRLLNRAGFPLVVLSNQSGVARGYFTLQRLGEVNRRFVQLLKQKGIRLSGVYYCPHGPEGGCSCRKPGPGLARKAARDLHLDLRRSFMVGDQSTDMKLASRIGAAGILVLTGAGRSVWKKAKPWTKMKTRNLATAARWIIKKEQSHEK